MFDITQLFIITSLVLGLLVGNAALNGDALRVQIAIPSDVSSAGFTEATAEEIFTAEAARIIRAPSIIPVPTLQVNSTPSIATALAKPLNLDGVAAALQSQFGINHLMVAGAVLAETDIDKVPAASAVRPLTPGVKLDLVLVVTQQHETPAQIVLEQQDGDATTLLRRGASWAMEQVSPYHVILTDALDGVHGDADGFARAQTAAQRMLAKPWDPEKASEIALVHNLLALIAMHTGDLAEADRQLTTAQALPGLLPAARTMIELNHCFLAIALKQPDQAATLLDETSKLGVRLTLPYLAEHLKLLGALIDWSRGNTAKAEAELRVLLSEPPINVAVRHYLSQLLVAEGNKATASDLPVLAPPAPRPDRIEALAPDLFWVDPSHGGVTKRL